MSENWGKSWMESDTTMGGVNPLSPLMQSQVKEDDVM
jgi:hypothetical protein